MKAVQVFEGNGDKHDPRSMVIIVGFIDKRFKNMTKRGWGCSCFKETELDQLQKTLLDSAKGITIDNSTAPAMADQLMKTTRALLRNRMVGNARVQGQSNDDLFVSVEFA